MKLNRPVTSDVALFSQSGQKKDKSRHTNQLYVLTAYPKTPVMESLMGSMSEYICKCRTLEYHGLYTINNAYEDTSEVVNARWQPANVNDTQNPNAGEVWEAVFNETEGDENYILISRSNMPAEFFLKPNLEVSY